MSIVEGGEGLRECADIATVLERIIKARNRQSKKKKEIFRHTTMSKCEHWKTKCQREPGLEDKKDCIATGTEGILG